MNGAHSRLYRVIGPTIRPNPVAMNIHAAIPAFAERCLALGGNAWFRETDAARNELVFEGRHHAYGAYRLRKEYGHHAALSILVALGLFTGAFMLPWALYHPSSAAPPSAPNNGFVILDFPQTHIQPPLLDPKPAATAAGAVAGHHPARAAGPVEAVDTAVAPVLPPDTLGGTKATTGPGAATVATGNGFTGAEPGLIGSTDVDSVWNDFQVEEAPRFTGGEAAMRQWVQRHLEFPKDLEGRDLVYVEFVVGADGHIEGARSVKGTGASTMAAAERAVRCMPQWTPARMNGHPVRCRLTLPIRFEVR